MWAFQRPDVILYADRVGHFPGIQIKIFSQPSDIPSIDSVGDHIEIFFEPGNRNNISFIPVHKENGSSCWKEDWR